MPVMRPIIFIALRSRPPTASTRSLLRLGCVTHIYVCGGYGSNLHMAVTCACGTSSARPCRELAFGARPACVRVEDFRLGHVLYAHVTETFVWGTPCAPQTNIFGKTDPFSPKLAHPVCPKRKSSPFILLKRAPNANYRHPLSRNVPQTQIPRRLLFPEIQSACFSETRSNIYVATNHPVQNASTYALVSHRPRGEPPPSPSYTRSFELLRFEKSRKRSESTRKTLPSDSCFAQILGVDDSEGLALPYASLQDSKGSFS